MIYGNDEKLLEQRIQEIMEWQNKDRAHRIDIEPFQMYNGRRTDLNLANIMIERPYDPTDSENSIYQYLINKKIEELTLDRLEQLKKITQNSPDFYSLETYLEEYEKQSGARLSELQIEGIRNFDKKIQEGVITGKYNLEDYITFLKSIPDLLSRKKALAIGHFDPEGYFWLHGEIYEEALDERNISEYTTYTFHRLNKGENRFAKENFKVIPSASIQKRMSPTFDRLCGIDLNTSVGTHCSEIKVARPVKLRGVEEHPNIKMVGKR